MASVLEQAISVGVESTYGVGVTPTISYEAENENWRQLVAPSNQGGYTRDQRAPLTFSDRSLRIGAAGSIRMPVMTEGMVPLMDHLWDLKHPGTDRPEAGATRYRRAWRAGAGGPRGSLTVDVYRVYRGGAGVVWRYPGCVATGFRLDVAAGELMTMAIDFDAAGESPTAGSVAPAYPDGLPWIWDDVRVQIGTPIVNDDTVTFDGVKSVALQVDFGMRRPDDGRRLGVSGRARPRRLDLAKFGGSLEMVPSDIEDFLRWRSDRHFYLTVRADGTNAAGHRRQFLVGFPNAKYDDVRDRAHRGRMTTRRLPWRGYQGLSGDTSPIFVLMRDGTPF